jgi:hypothetical protein
LKGSALSAGRLVRISFTVFPFCFIYFCFFVCYSMLSVCRVTMTANGSGVCDGGEF